jgi:F420-dependent oxidoreductase-like protein
MSEIKFGLTLPQGWRHDLVDKPPIQQFEYSKNIALAADKLRFDSVYAYDHFIPHYNYEKHKTFFECFTLNSAIASITKNVKIGQIVTCNSYRNPGLLAKMVATLDAITNGRAELGIGAGWYEEEYVAYGYDFPANRIRIEQLDESISIIKQMWKRKYATFIGKHYSIRKAVCNPKPIQKPHPPIMVGGSGEKYLLKVAAKQADRYNLYFGTPEEMKRKIDIIKEYCVAAGRKFSEIEYSVVLPCVIRKDQKAVQKDLQKRKKKGKTIEQFKLALAGGYAIGTPEEIVAGLRKYIEIGVTHYVLHFMALDESILKLFRSKVVNKL